MFPIAELDMSEHESTSHANDNHDTNLEDTFSPSYPNLVLSDDLDVHRQEERTPDGVSTSMGDTISLDLMQMRHTNRPRLSTMETSVSYAPTIDEEESIAPGNGNTNHSHTSKPGDETSYLKRCTKGCLSFLFFDGNKEALGIGLDQIPGGAVTVTAAIYFSVTILYLARKSAGCATEIPEGQHTLPECNNRAFGIKPSSFIPLLLSIISIITAIFMPIIGAFLDCSDYRRFAGRLTALIITLLTFAQIFTNEQTWFYMAIAQVLSSITQAVHHCIVMAYLPETSDNNLQRTRFAAGMSMWFNLTFIIMILSLTIALSALRLSDHKVISNRIATSVTCILQVIFFTYNWTYLFGYRPARIEQMHGQSGAYQTVRLGLTRLKRTIKRILNERTELKWFLFAKCATQSGAIASSAILLSYLDEFLFISSKNLAITTIIALVSAIPGSMLSPIFTKWLNPLRSLMYCFLYWAFLIPLFALLVYKPGQEIRLFIFAIFWGLGLGWREPTDKALFCDMIPRGHEAEMMGIYILAGQIFMWVPPLLTTVFNEAGFSLRYNFMSLGVYFFIGFVCMIFMGPYYYTLVGTKADEKDEANEVIERHQEATQRTVYTRTSISMSDHNIDDASIFEHQDP